MVCSAWRHAALAGNAAGRMLRTLLNNKFDGDTASLNILYSQEAIKEAEDYMQSVRYYVGADGNINFSAQTDTTKFVLHNFTSDID